MKLDREVKHKSEDIDDEVLLDVIKAIGRRVRVVNRSYDIPYIAGYSKDGSTVFIDRHVPRTVRFLRARCASTRSFSRTRSWKRRCSTSCVYIISTLIRSRCVPSAMR